MPQPPAAAPEAAVPRPALRRLAVLGLALAVAGCSSGVNPMNWGGDAPVSIDPETTRAAEIGRRPLVADVTALSIEPMDGGVIVRATGLPPSQGYWDAALVPSPRDAVDGVMTYRFVAVPPPGPTATGTPWSREVEAAAFISTYDLGAIREIVVQGETNQRVSRR